MLKKIDPRLTSILAFVLMCVVFAASAFYVVRIAAVSQREVVTAEDHAPLTLDDPLSTPPSSMPRP